MASVSGCHFIAKLLQTCLKCWWCFFCSYCWVAWSYLEHMLHCLTFFSFTLPTQVCLPSSFHAVFDPYCFLFVFIAGSESKWVSIQVASSVGLSRANLSQASQGKGRENWTEFLMESSGGYFPPQRQAVFQGIHSPWFFSYFWCRFFFLEATASKCILNGSLWEFINFSILLHPLQFVSLQPPCRECILALSGHLSGLRCPASHC